MYDAYKRGLMLPSEFYELKKNNKGEYRILQAFIEYYFEKDYKTGICPLVNTEE